MHAVSNSPIVAPNSHDNMGNGPFETSWLEGWETFEREWKELSARTKPFSPFCEWAWIDAWRIASNDKADLRFLTIRNSQRIVAIFPMTFLKRPGRFALRRLVPLAYGGHFEFNGLTEEPIWRCEEEFEAAAWSEAITEIRRSVAAGEIECAILRRLAISPIREPTRIGKFVFEHQKLKPGPNIVELPADWQTYRSHLTRSMRDNFAYYPKLVLRRGHRAETIIANAAEIETASTELVRLHRLRAAVDPTLRHMDYFSDPRATAMLRAGLSAMATLGKAFVALLIIDGGVAAAQGFLEADNTLLAHYSGFDPEWAKFSPLFILQAEVIRSAIERGITRLDLLPGRNLWQTRWGAQPEMRLEKRLFLSLRPAAIFRAVIYGLTRQLRAIWRRSRLGRRVHRSPSG
jgi:CelD/BcsL family acetyltransferase involved in cellulose biosynthesis